MGKVLRDAGVKVFQIETTLNTDIFPAPFDFLAKREWEWTARDRATFLATTQGARRACRAGCARKIFQSIEAPHQMTSVQAGEVEAVHRSTTGTCHQQQLVQVEGQTDILTMGIPYICPYNVELDHEPDPRDVHSGSATSSTSTAASRSCARAGCVIMTHPTPWDFHPVHHPSYIDFFEQVLAETTDPLEIEAEYEKQFAEDEWYRHLYRTSYAYHGVHPFYMWYWGAHGMQHVGRVIIVGGDPRAVRRLGFTPASTLDDALEMATDVVGPHADHHPPAHPAAPAWRTCTERRSDGAPRTGLPAPLAGSPQRRPAPCAASGGRRSSSAASTRRSASRTARRPCPAASSCRRSQRRSAPTTTPSGPARRRPASPRAVITDGPLRLARAGRRRPRDRRRSTGSPTCAALEDADAPPVIFTANHHSHLDTPLLPSRPSPSRGARHLVVGAAADYFFDNRVTGTASALVLERDPDRPRRSTGRKSADLAARLIDDGWSLLIFPEGGRSPDGWGQPFKGGAAFLSIRTGAPVVPVFIEGTGSILGKGMKRPEAGQDHGHVRRAAVARARARAPAASTTASSRPSPSSATRRSPTGGRPATGRPPGPARR